MTDERHIPLTLTSHYASSWGLWEGIRELVQNWHDGLYEMLDSLDIVSSTPLRVQFRKTSKVAINDEFEAFVIKPLDQSKVLLGVLLFDGLTNQLTLINKSTSLHKRVLLMGYSAKTEKKEVIGQFGEGLKVGALSLVRDGRPVVMETSTDRWRFDLIHNKEFGEKVLTVVVSERSVNTDNVSVLSDDSFPTCPKTLESSDTCTSVSNVMLDEWRKFINRFLFLCPAQDCVKTELGTLLLDDHLAGQLHVKGVWVSDLTGEDLAAGVDFQALQVDRDRNAVPRPSEIDHLMSGIWIKAVTQKPNLISKYYDLLLEDKYRDVRHAAQYVNDTDIPQLISSQFIMKHGRDVLPVLNTVSMQKLQEIRTELNANVVLCNQTLLNILKQSGNILSVDEAISVARSKRSTQIPYSRLNEEQQSVLRHATKLVAMAYPKFSLASVDIIKTENFQNCYVSGDRMVIPAWFLDKDIVHKAVTFCPGHKNVCLCREAWLCIAVLEALKDKLPKRSTNLSKAEIIELSKTQPIPTQAVVALLAMESCEKSQGFCSDLHTGQSSGEATALERLKAEFEERETKYLDSIEDLKQKLEREVRENTANLAALQTKLDKAQKEMMSQEISTVDIQERMRRHCEEKIKQAHDEAKMTDERYDKKLKDSLAQFTEAQKDLQYKETIINSHARMGKEDAEVFRRKEESLNEELQHYIKKHKTRESSFLNSLAGGWQELPDALILAELGGIRKQICCDVMFLVSSTPWTGTPSYRTEHLSTICSEGLQSDDSTVKEKCQKLADICDVVYEELQSEKFICGVCKVKRKNTVFLPCGHYIYCADCARTIMGNSSVCPICKRITHSQETTRWSPL